MRRFLKWLLITLGVAAVVRKLGSRKHAPEPAAEPAVAAPSADDPADELRRKLAESRGPEASAAGSEGPEGSVEERRADVHDQGRATIDEMRSTTEDE